MNKGYQNLANAIIWRAVEDWKNANSILSKPHSQSADITYKRMKNDCEIFFNSDYFNRFSELDGKALLKKLKERFSKEEN